MQSSPCLAFAASYPLTQNVLSSKSVISSRKPRNLIRFASPLNRRVCSIRCSTDISTSTDSSPSDEQSSLFNNASSKSEILPDIESLSANDRDRIESVRDLLEFWFSAVNLRRDWYLKRRMDENGWLDPSIFLNFNRMKDLRAIEQDIIFAAKLSDELEVLSPSEEETLGDGDGLKKTHIRRSQSLPDFNEWDEDELRSSFMLKSIPYNSSVDSIKEIFQPYGKIVYIRVYRNHSIGDNTIAKRALICFENQESAERVYQAFSNSAPEKACGITIRRRHLSPGSEGYEMIATNKSLNSIDGEGRSSLPLVVVHVTDMPEGLDWKTLYQSLEQTMIVSCNRRPRYVLYHYGDTECYVTIIDAPAVRDMINIFEEKGIQIAGNIAKLRLLQDEAEIEQYWAYAKTYQENRQKGRLQRAAYGNTGKGVTGNDGPGFNRRPVGVVVKVTGLSANLSWRKISAELSAITTIVFLNYSRGDDFCYARVGNPEDAQLLCKSFTGDDLPLQGENIKAYVLEDDEEQQYWDDVDEKLRMKQARLEEVDAESQTTEVQSA